MHEHVRLTRDLRREGFSDHELARMTRAGALHHVRRGGYSGHRPSDAEARHRQLIDTSLPVLDPSAVLSHASAAVIYGLPTWNQALERVNVIKEHDSGGRIGSVVHVHPMVLPAEEITVVNGIVITTLARTVADCARTLPYAHGVAVGDAALRMGMTRADLDAVIRRKPRRVGNPKARRVAAFIDARSESPYESMSRVRLAEFGIPEPTLQLEIVDPSTGLVVATVDFGWEEERRRRVRRQGQVRTTARAGSDGRRRRLQGEAP